jgi:hypothetical protein
MQGSSKKNYVDGVKSINHTLSKKVTEPMLTNNLKSKPDIDLSSINSKEKNKLNEVPYERDGIKKEDILSGTDQDL